MGRGRARGEEVGRAAGPDPRGFAGHYKVSTYLKEIILHLFSKLLQCRFFLFI